MTARTGRPPATRRQPGGVRHALDVAYGCVAAVLVAGVLLQVYFAALGVFGINGRTAEDAGSFDLHRSWGGILTIIAAVLLVLALAAWRSRAAIVGSAVLLVLAAVAQSLLASAGDSNKWVGGLHGLDGMVILLLSVWLAVSAWRRLTAPRAGSAGRAPGSGHEV